MKPASFTYTAAEDLEHAATALADLGEDAKILGGGQSLVPIMNLRLAAPAHLVDVTTAADAHGVDRRNGFVAVGAAVTAAQAEDDEQLGTVVPLLREALEHVAHREIRTAGTICGAVAHGDAAGEAPTVALTLDAQMVARSIRGERVIAAADFFRGFLTTALEPDEVLAEVRFPVGAPGSGSAFLELAPRHGDYALAGVAAHVVLDGDRVARAALGFLAVDAHPVRAPEAEAALTGAVPDAEALAGAARIAADSLSPGTDLHATARHRQALAGTLAERALARAVARAHGADPDRKEQS